MYKLKENKNRMLYVVIVVIWRQGKMDKPPGPKVKTERDQKFRPVFEAIFRNFTEKVENFIPLRQNFLPPRRLSSCRYVCSII